MLVKQLRDYVSNVPSGSKASECEVVLSNGNKLVKINFNLNTNELILTFKE
tara:strand:- start:1721 stop:1873 length:153 start_codon:yes stop_codon:yes gene_type:complete